MTSALQQRIFIARTGSKSADFAKFEVTSLKRAARDTRRSRSGTEMQEWRRALVRKLGRRAFAGALVLMAGAGAAQAATDSDTMNVTANVISTCNVDADDLLFGDYDPVSNTPLDGATTIDVTCTNGTTYTVAIDEGLGSGASVGSRRMTNGANVLVYSLYRNGGRTNVWGETPGVDTVAGTGTGLTQTLDVYGRVPINQTAPAGPYADVVTVTVTY